MKRIIVYSDELYHHGVKGMKWGIRHNPEREQDRLAKRKLRAQAKADRIKRNERLGYGRIIANRMAKGYAIYGAQLATNVIALRVPTVRTGAQIANSVLGVNKVVNEFGMYRDLHDVYSARHDKNYHR